MSETALRNIHMKGYVDAIAAGVKTIMVSYSSFNGTKMSANEHLLTEVLKNELGFKGILVSDWDAINQLSGPPSQQIKTAINAGLDMVMMSTNYISFLTNLKTLVQNGDIAQSRIDDAVRRILKVKYEAGLFDQALADRTFTLTVGSSEHREIARTCVQESLVLLRNSPSLSSTLPLNVSLPKIFVAGKNADDIGNQCGGWTISWQGSSGATTTGTTILQAIKDAVDPSTIVTYNKTGTGATGYNIGIVVIGETPYAEGAGDKADLTIDNDDITAIDNVKNAGVPTVVIVVSGRPLVIPTATLSHCDSLIAAWLPGTEGEGVADLLFGVDNTKFSGKLSFTWPADNNLTPLNPFILGYGLTD